MKRKNAGRRLRSIENRLAVQRPWLAELTRRGWSAAGPGGTKWAAYERARNRVAALEAERAEIEAAWLPALPMESTRGV